MPVIRNPITGRFMPAVQAARIPDRGKVENFLRARLGNPPAGKSWYAIAGRYPERFEDYLADAEA